MARTIEQVLQNEVGAMHITIAALTAQLEEAKEENARLRAELEEKKDGELPK